MFLRYRVVPGASQFPKHEFNWYLDRVVHFDRSDSLTVDHDIERATADLHADRFMGHLESCRHL
jgi:hypothetical protein